MPGRRRIIIIAKERPFDEEKWKHLLTAFAYVLHEQRKAQGQAQAEYTRPKGSDDATLHEAAP